MIRKIIRIDRDKCDGCGLCVNACHEGAIALADGKAALIRDDYCDGLGDCLPACPTGAINFEEREALEYNEEEVKLNMKKNAEQQEKLPCGCPGTAAKAIVRLQPADGHPGKETSNGVASTAVEVQSQLNQWPVQIKLVPVNAPWFENARLLLAADCAAYAYGNFHSEFMRGAVTLIGCPKLDDCDYSEKLTEILKSNNVKSITVARMEVPCCGGIEHAVKTALTNSGKMIPWQVVTISTDGQILEV